ncbi:Rho GTPase-activating protein 8 [Nibea albiflora]|uniref:Rho GTPase-activating protein 8 n=1 Tax=Nibea albiflora TaxID=240163 RepID=A0ACB7EU45_NIBAL|nr:Rho GTPase-activating protein 8 [Nibea albiflora]
MFVYIMTELQREEQEEEQQEEQQCVTDAPSLPPSSSVTPDSSHPYYDVARHGIIQVSGDDNYGRKLIIFSSCCLPPSHQLNHRRLLEYVHVNPLQTSADLKSVTWIIMCPSVCRYLKFTLDQYVEMDYILVYFHHGLRSSNKPSLKWLREAYKKNLKALYVVHPTNFIRIVWNIFKPLISHKFGKKLTYVNYLAELRDHLNYEQLIVPPDVLRHDEKLRAAQKDGPPPSVKSPPPRPPLPTQQFGVSLQYVQMTASTDEALMFSMLTVSMETGVDRDVVLCSGKAVNFDEYADVHVPAVILKTFLRELPEPLLTFRVYSQVQEILNVESSLRVSRCKQIVESLPEHHFIVTKFLLCFLHTVSQESIVNKMSPSNLACVFGVNLVWPRRGSISLSALTPINIFTEILIEHFHTVFGSRCPPAQAMP